jgi:superfamily II DNA or RNA helicase
VLFQVSNIWVNVIGSSEDDEARLWNLLSFEPPQAKFTTAYRTGSWDGKVRLFQLGHKRFPAGLWFWLKDKLLSAFPGVVVQDIRSKPARVENVTFPVQLRLYQQEAVRQVLEKERGILWIPTGAGKTEIACAVSQFIEGRKLFLVHRKDLLHQTYERFRKYGQDVGRVGGGYKEFKHDVVVSTIQTFSKVDKEWYKGWSAVFFDECHLVPADVFYRTAMRIDAYYRIGMSGTPLARSDERSIYLICATGPVLIRVKPDELAKEGYLVLPRVIFHRVPNVPGLNPLAITMRNDLPVVNGISAYHKEYEHNIVNNIVRNRLVCKLAIESKKPCLIFVREIDHGHKLQSIFRSEFNLEVPFVWGNTLQEVRNRFRRAMAKGTLDILIASVIFEEGIDIPDLRTIVVASAGKSGIKTIQRVGRGMRPSTNKDEVVVHDFIDTGRWTSKHSRVRKKLYLQEGYRVEEAD